MPIGLTPNQADSKPCSSVRSLDACSIVIHVELGEE